jgi:hypothetical protein
MEGHSEDTASRTVHAPGRACPSDAAAARLAHALGVTAHRENFVCVTWLAGSGNPPASATAVEEGRALDSPAGCQSRGMYQGKSAGQWGGGGNLVPAVFPHPPSALRRTAFHRLPEHDRTIAAGSLAQVLNLIVVILSLQTHGCTWSEQYPRPDARLYPSIIRLPSLVLGPTYPALSP